jgi:hypothetical protein
MKDYLASFVNTNGVAFPNTAAVNSSGGGATDGTEFVKIMVDDDWGFAQALLTYTDDTPSGNSETATVSQKLNSIKKIVSNMTELSSNTTHTVEEWNKRSVLILSAGCTIARLVGGTGADETNRLLVQNNNTVTAEIDFGANQNEEEIIIQPGQWIELVYDSEALKFIFQKSNRDIIINTAIDYTIGDWVPSGTKIIVNCNTAAQYGLITITLSTLADNIGKNYTIEHGANSGLIKIDGEGSEYLNFKSSRILTALIYNSGNGYRVENNGTDWVMHGVNIMDFWSARSDWTAVHAGNGVIYDGKNAAINFTGMSGTEETSGNTFLCVYDSGGTEASGTLYYINITGTMLLTNDKRLTMSSAHYCLVNHATGSNKDVDSDVCHNFAIDGNKILKTRPILNNTAVFAGAVDSNSYNTANYNGDYMYVDTNNLRFQIATVGMRPIGDNGNDRIMADAFIYQILDFSC